MVVDRTATATVDDEICQALSVHPADLSSQSMLDVPVSDIVSVVFGEVQDSVRIRRNTPESLAILKRFARIEAKRRARADTGAPVLDPFGLRRPVAIRQIVLTNGTVHRLELGGSVGESGDRYARVDGGAIFVLDADEAAALSEVP